MLVGFHLKGEWCCMFDNFICLRVYENMELMCLFFAGIMNNEYFIADGDQVCGILYKYLFRLRIQRRPNV